MGTGPEFKDDENDSAGSTPSRRLDFDPQSFVNVGSWLSAQERRPVASTTTQTDRAPEIPPKSRRNFLFLAGLVFLVVLLSATNVYFWHESRLWEAERFALQGRIESLETLTRKGARQATELASMNNACRGELLDTCWFKVGLGNCAKDALGDPIRKAEDAWRSAWDNTLGAIGAAGDAVVRDFEEFGKGLRSVGDAAMHLLGRTCGTWSEPSV